MSRVQETTIETNWANWFHRRYGHPTAEHIALQKKGEVLGKGWPDRIIFPMKKAFKMSDLEDREGSAPLDDTFFIEFKAPDEVVRGPHGELMSADLKQREIHSRLRKLGYKVYVVADFDGARKATLRHLPDPIRP